MIHAALRVPWSGRLEIRIHGVQLEFHPRLLDENVVVQGCRASAPTITHSEEKSAEPHFPVSGRES
jgi:hypothetical protein